MFLPTTPGEIKSLGWKSLDVILVTGDSYIDSPFIGIAVIGKVLLNAGFKVGIIAQPDINTDLDIKRLGEPELFWGVSGGSVDSLVANYTATRKKRQKDDFTPGGINNRRPDRAVIAYTNLIRRNFKDTAPVVLGGIEASLRRVAHYDFWSNKIRRSILFDAKADILMYGMAEKSVIELAKALREGKNYKEIRGLCYIGRETITDFIALPDYESAAGDRDVFTRMFSLFYENNDPATARGLIQKHGDRYLVQNPPALYLTRAELDGVYGLDFERDLHPWYKKQGNVRALETIKFSISTHQGCYGECNFCAIAVHQGRTVRWRSEKSILDEAEILTKTEGFKGYILDAGGPTANMYGFECKKKLEKGSCRQKRCLFPTPCPQLPIDHSPQIALLNKLKRLKGIKKVFVASGIRYDLILTDKAGGEKYLTEIVADHVSGQMKIAPEHTEAGVLKLMGKPDQEMLVRFKAMFERINRRLGKKQFLTYYLIAAHPGCREKDMKSLKSFIREKLKVTPEQVQVFTPTPSTWASLMYYTEKNPFTGERIFVEKDLKKKERQKLIITAGDGAGRKNETKTFNRKRKDRPQKKESRFKNRKKPVYGKK